LLDVRPDAVILVMLRDLDDVARHVGSGGRAHRVWGDGPRSRYHFGIENSGGDAIGEAPSRP